jgi:hypothetical protein
VDETAAAGFESSYDDWQYAQVDFGKPVVFTQIRRRMSGSEANRGAQGEGFSYSVDGTMWTQFTNANSTGWEAYNNYAPNAWQYLPYGWSAWLKLRWPATARYIRFNWDGNSDTVNELQLDRPLDSGDPSYDFADTDPAFQGNFVNHVGSYTHPAGGSWQQVRHNVGLTGQYDGHLFGTLPNSSGWGRAYVSLRDQGAETRGKLTIVQAANAPGGALMYDGGPICGSTALPFGAEIDVRVHPWTSYDNRFSEWDVSYHPRFGDSRQFATGSTTRRVETLLVSGQATFTIFAMLQVGNAPLRSDLVGELLISAPSPCTDTKFRFQLTRREDVLRASLGW